MRFDGSSVRLRRFPQLWSLWFAPGQVAWEEETGPDLKIKAYMATDQDPRPRRMELLELADLGAGASRAKASLAGFLDRSDLLVRISHVSKGKRRAAYYSTLRGRVPLPSWLSVNAVSPLSHLLVARAHAPFVRRVGAISVYDTRSFRPLWTRSFTSRGRAVPVAEVRLTPSGRRVVVALDDQWRDVLILDSRSGRLRARLKFPTVLADFEDDKHVIYPAYDGPPNPLYNPADEFAAPEELEWENMLVRCSFSGNCERAARVDAPEKSIHLGDTALRIQ